MKLRLSSFTPFVILLLVVWSITAMLRSGAQGNAEGEIVSRAKRETATFSGFPLLEGGEWKLSDHKGKVVLVNMWATWCPPCRAETPDLVQVAKDLKPEGVEVIGVSMDDGDALPIRRFVSDYHIPYPIARGNDERSFSMGIPLPMTLVFDREGKLAIRTVGAIDRESLTNTIRTLLAER